MVFGEIQRDFRNVVFVGPFFFGILYGYSNPFVAHLPVNYYPLIFRSFFYTNQDQDTYDFFSTRLFKLHVKDLVIWNICCSEVRFV